MQCVDFVWIQIWIFKMITENIGEVYHMVIRYIKELLILCIQNYGIYIKIGI